MESVILALGLLVFLGHLLVAMFKRIRVPDVLVLMVVGIALGPFGLGWVTPDHFGAVGPVMVAIALIVILFEGGLNTSLETVAKAAIGTASITLATAAVTVGLIAIIAHDHLGGWMPALIAGAILSGTSAAVVIPMISALNLGDKTRTTLSLESALTDVTCIVLTVGLLDAVLRGGEATAVQMTGKAFSSMVSAGALGMVVGLGWLLIHERLRAVPNTRLAIIAGVFVLYGVAETFGFSGGIAALAFGVTAAHFSRPDTPETLGGVRIGRIADDERSLFTELVFLCKLVFFLYLGISMRFDDWGTYQTAGLIVGAVYAARILLTRLLLPRDCSARDAAITAIMAPKGLAAAVIATSVAQTPGFPEGEAVKELAYAAVLVSIVTTSVLVPVAEMRPARWLALRFFRTHVGEQTTARLPNPTPRPE